MVHPTNAYYDAMAANYHLFYRDWHAAVKRDGVFLHELFLNQHVTTVLDASCGTGTQSLGLVQYGYQVTGIDPSSKAIEQARQYALTFGVEENTTFQRGSFLSLPNNLVNAYDAVISQGNSLPHLLGDAELEQAIANMFQVLRPDGFLVIGIRDFDTLLEEHIRYTPRTFHEADDGTQTILFDIRDFHDGPPPTITFNTFVVRGREDQWETTRHRLVYRALRKAELTSFLEQTGFTQITMQDHMFEIIFTARKP